MIIHGLSHTREYKIWAGIKQRCLNPKDTGYVWYGARGIGVCKRWHKFENFWKDMGKCPTGFELERLDNEDDYKPSNCKWMSHQENCMNRRMGKPFTSHGVKYKNMADACRKLNKSYQMTIVRIFRGWTIDKALHTPEIFKEKKIIIDGLEFDSITKACKFFKIDRRLASIRVKRGWTWSRAFKTPPGPFTRK